MSYSSWPHRCALATFVATCLLIGMGSLVTTYGAGMAIKGWWLVEGADGTEHFLPLFPSTEWFHDWPKFLEHSHRLLGMLVGGLALFTAAAVHLTRTGNGAVRAAWIAVVAVAAQGAIGGFRVLENSPKLAFLHGVTAQITFALIALVVLATSRAWQTGERGGAERAPVGLAWTAVVFAIGQVALGAWYRHGLRNPEVELAAGALHMHITGAVALLGLVIALAVALTLCARVVSERNGDLGAHLMRSKKRLHALIGAQIVLGVAALIARGDPEYTSSVESLVAFAHVVVAALVVAQCAVLIPWLERARQQGGVA